MPEVAREIESKKSCTMSGENGTARSAWPRSGDCVRTAESQAQGVYGGSDGGQGQLPRGLRKNILTPIRNRVSGAGRYRSVFDRRAASLRAAKIESRAVLGLLATVKNVDYHNRHRVATEQVSRAAAVAGVASAGGQSSPGV